MMAVKGGVILGSSKETTAVIMNLKETRVLDKSVQTLSLEESYAAKLLDLNKKMVRFNYSRLKKNVNKIQTHLRTEDIAVMKSLESEGRFKAEHPRICSSTNTTKIAAAQKRLKLDRYRRAQSALPVLDRHSQGSEEEVREETTDESSNKSSDKQFADDEPRVSCRFRNSRPKTSICIASVNCSEADSQSTKVTPRSPRPKTAATILERIAKAQKAHKNYAPQSTFSCHDEKPTGANGATENAEKSALDVFGPNPYEERRKKFMTMESETLNQLTDKKTGFVKEVEKFVKENPAVVEMKPEKTKQVIESIDSMAKRPGMMPQGARGVEESLYKQLAEIRKTRYLRVEDSKLDIKTTNTLAHDFLKKTEKWRQYTANAKTLRDSVQL